MGRDLIDYFEEEILSGLSDEARGALDAMLMPHRLVHKLMVELIGGADAARYIAEVESQGLLTRINAGNGRRDRADQFGGGHGTAGRLCRLSRHQGQHRSGGAQRLRSVADEFGAKGIRVNALAPGYISTDLNADFWESDAGKAMLRRIPQRRLGRLEDLDGALLLLASPASAYMTGSVITIDGGHLSPRFEGMIESATEVRQHPR